MESHSLSKSIWWILLFCQIFYLSLSAQHLTERFKTFNYTIEDGLASNQVYYTYQDTRGDLWIATDAGVSVFNGIDFVNYGISDGLVDNAIFKIYEDKANRMWLLSHRGGLCYFEKGKFKIPKFNEKLIQALNPKDYVFDITVLDGTLYLATRYGSSGYFTAQLNGMFQHQNLEQHITRRAGFKSLVWQLELTKGQSISGIYVPTKESVVERSQDVWFETKRWNDKVLKLYHLASDQNNRHQVLRDKGGNDIVIQHARAVVVKPDYSYYTYTFPSSVISAAMEDNNLYFALQGGGIEYFKKELKSKNKQLLCFASSRVASINQDCTGSFWLSTFYQGLIQVPNLDQRLYTLTASNTNLAIPSSFSLHKDTLKYIVGNHLDVNLYKEGKLSPLERKYIKSHNDKPVIQQSCWLSPNYFFLNYSSYSSSAKRDTLFGQRWLQNNRKDFIRNVQPSKQEGKVLVATKRGFYTLEQHGVKLDSKHLGFEEEVNCILETTDTTYLLGTERGLFYYQNKSINLYQEGTPFFKTSITDLKLDHYGRVWVLTKERGIVILDSDQNTFVTKREWLSSNHCNRLVLKKNKAWVATNKGLNVLYFDDRGIDSSQFFGSSDGLVSDLIENIIIGDSISLVQYGNSFSLLADDRKRSKPKVFLDEITIEDSTYSSDRTVPHSLKSSNNSIRFQYQTNALLNKGKTYYKYRLLGKDSSWFYSHNRTVTFQDLQAGKYKFQLFARDVNGNWSDEALIFPFDIAKHPFQTIWFWGVVSLLIISISVTTTLLIRKRQQKQMLMQYELFQAGIRALRSQINPHFMFNALNSIRYFLMVSENDAANIYLVKFSRLLRGLLGNMEENKLSLNSEIQMITDYLMLEETRLKKALNWKIHVQEELKTESASLPPMLLQPLIENAIWHGLKDQKENGKVDIHFKLKEKNLFCVITDNGKGFKNTYTHSTEEMGEKGIGLKNIKERLQLFEKVEGKTYQLHIKDIQEISNGMENGTQVTLIIPQS